MPSKIRLRSKLRNSAMSPAMPLAYSMTYMPRPRFSDSLTLRHRLVQIQNHAGDGCPGGQFSRVEAAFGFEGTDRQELFSSLFVFAEISELPVEDLQQHLDLISSGLAGGGEAE